MTSAQWLAWHTEREQAATAPFGLASVIGTVWLDDRAVSVDGLRGRWSVRDGAVRGELSEGAVVLAVGEEHRIDEVRVVALGRAGRVGIRVFDPSAPDRSDVLGIDTYPEDSRWRVIADFTAAPAGAVIGIDHADGWRGPLPLAGTVAFVRPDDPDGDPVELRAFALPDGRLQISFADTTRGPETTVFRFLVAEAPEGGTVVLDFNRAFLPPSSFTPHYLCPLPPADNRLPFAIDSGERALRRVATVGARVRSL
ncbi:DUF1684 domain-containing protein [Gordonia sp. NPDC003376]